MALTLPYPNLDFVPLDVLTAEQMNQMVANTNYIANQFPIKTANIDWQSYYYKPGDSIPFNNYDVYFAGRERVLSGAKSIYATLVLEKPVSSSAHSITFTPTGYIEAFDSSGAIFSSATYSNFNFTCGFSTTTQRNLIRLKIDILSSSITINHNHSCVVSVMGNFTIS